MQYLVGEWIDMVWMNGSIGVSGLMEGLLWVDGWVWFGWMN